MRTVIIQCIYRRAPGDPLAYVGRLLPANSPPSSQSGSSPASPRGPGRPGGPGIPRGLVRPRGPGRRRGPRETHQSTRGDPVRASGSSVQFTGDLHYVGMSVVEPRWRTVARHESGGSPGGSVTPWWVFGHHTSQNGKQI